jgi:hypothetical protein
MYKYITLARNNSNLWATPMYIYQNIENNKYYITRTFPYKASFTGDELIAPSTYYSIEYPILIDDINKKNVSYWNQIWTFSI